jgi:hypothetical protein
MLPSVQLSDFIISISRGYIVCSTPSGTVASKMQKNPSGMLASLRCALKDAILKAENLFAKRLNKATITFDFEPLDKTTIKVAKKVSLDTLKLKFDIEKKFNRKVIAFSLTKEQKSYNVFEIVSLKTEEIEQILDVITDEKIEIIDVKSTFELISKEALNFSKSQALNVVYFKKHYAEVAILNNKKIIEYKVIPEFGINSILNSFTQKFKINAKDIKTIIENYRTVSRTERMQKYYEREELDFDLKEFIEDTNLISALHSEIKNQMSVIINEVSNSFGINKEQSFCFAYEHEFAKLQLHHFLQNRSNDVEFEGLDIIFKKTNKVRNSFVVQFSSQIKNFFHLNA